MTRVAEAAGAGPRRGVPRPILAIAPELRTEAQQDDAARATSARSTPSWREAAERWPRRKEPLPIDPKLQELRERARAGEAAPVPVDPRLAQLRKDVEMSIQQTANRRLTAAQDIAWALINSPAFLFNH